MDLIHKDDSINISPLDLDCFDENYEFRAPMFYDFNNPNEKAEDGDKWFDYHEDDLLSPSQMDKSLLSSQSIIGNSPFGKQIEKSQNKLIIKKPNSQSSISKNVLKSVINKQKTTAKTFSKFSSSQLSTLKPIRKNNSDLNKPENTVKKLYGSTKPRYLEPTKSMLYAINQKENVSIIKTTSLKSSLVKGVNSKVSTVPKKPILFNRTNQPIRPLSRISATQTKKSRGDISKLHTEYTMSQRLRMEQKNKVIRQQEKTNNSPFRLKEEMRKHNITKCTPTTMKILREKRRKPLTIPVTPEFMKRYKLRERNKAL